MWWYTYLECYGSDEGVFAAPQVPDQGRESFSQDTSRAKGVVLVDVMLVAAIQEVPGEWYCSAHTLQYRIHVAGIPQVLETSGSVADCPRGTASKCTLPDRHRVGTCCA